MPWRERSDAPVTEWAGTKKNIVYHTRAIQRDRRKRPSAGHHL